jgi:glycerol-3-phosphate dehydrogenase
MKLNDTVYKKYIVPSQEFTLYSINLFAKRLCIDDSKTSDGRVLFAVPWHNKIVVGTTDT